MEVHPENDQFFRFEKGNGKCIIDGNEYEVKPLNQDELSKKIAQNDFEGNVYKNIFKQSF